MPFVPFQAAAIAHVNYEWFGQKVQNTLWFNNSDDINPVSMADLAQLLDDYVHLNWLPLQSNEITYRGVEAIAQRTQIDLTYTSSAHTGEAGGAATPSVSNSVTLAISFRSAFTGRSNRGRNYWLGMPAGNVLNNVVSGAYIENVLDAYEGMVGLDAIAPNWTWVVASKYTQNAPRVLGAVVPVQTISVADSIIDNQRRRLPSRGV